MPAKSTGKVKVLVHLDAAHGDHGRYLAGREYEVDKATAEWLLEDPRVAVPVRGAGGKTEHATTEE